MFLANDYEAKFKQIAFSESVRISGARKKIIKLPFGDKMVKNSR